MIDRMNPRLSFHCLNYSKKHLIIKPQIHTFVFEVSTNASKVSQIFHLKFVKYHLNSFYNLSLSIKVSKSTFYSNGKSTTNTTWRSKQTLPEIVLDDASYTNISPTIKSSRLSYSKKVRTFRTPRSFDLRTRNKVRKLSAPIEDKVDLIKNA